jgi:hypothetical protein
MKPRILSLRGVVVTRMYARLSAACISGANEKSLKVPKVRKTPARATCPIQIKPFI